MGKKLKDRWEGGKIFGKIKSGIFVSLAACFMLFVFAPLEIYLNNPGEFWYDAYLLFPFCLGGFGISMLVCILVFLTAYFLGDKIYDIALAGCFFIFAALYIQGNFLVNDLPPFDGTDVYWEPYRGKMTGSFVWWLFIAIVVFAILIILKKDKFRKMVSAVSLLFFAILFSTLGVMGVSGGLFEQKQFVRFTKNDQFEMSQDENFIILLLDAIDEECFREIWEQHPEYREGMADFTFYNNTLTGYPYTEHALPLMLSGEWYENDEPFRDYELRVYRDAPIFNKLEENGYTLSFYDDELQFEIGEMDGEFANMTSAKSSLLDAPLFAKRQMKMVGVKYAPWPLKPYCWFDPAKLWHQQMPAKGEKLFVWKNKSFYDDIQSDEITYANQKCFKLIHLMGAHVPFYYDRDVNEIENADYYSCMESAMTVTLAYLEKLKSAGVYDNSVIIVMSDHGYNISGDAARIPQRDEDCSGRQHPILFIKGRGERHELQISGAPISFEDLPGGFEKLLQGAGSDSVFDYKEGDYRERRYMLYHYAEEDHMTEYVQKGYAGDESTMFPTGRTFDYK